MAAAVEMTFGQLSDWFSRLNGELQTMSFRPALETCKVIAVADVRMNFVGQHDPDGNPWKPLMGRRPRGGNQILRDRGLLMASTGAQGGEPAVNVVTDTVLEIGTNLEYAAIHQHGGTIVPKSAKALSVPISREAYRAGSPRQFGKTLRMVWPKGRTTGLLVEDVAGKGKKARGAKSVMHFLLLPKAEIPARPFLGWNEKTLTKCDHAISTHIIKQLDRLR